MSPEPFTSGPLPRKWDKSFFFKTRTGRIGVLQIRESEPSKFVTFRYKLITENGKPLRSVAPRTWSMANFGEVRERTLTSIETGKESMMQLDNGDIYVTPEG